MTLNVKILICGILYFKINFEHKTLNPQGKAPDILDNCLSAVLFQLFR